ncbi:hypothetical protein IEO21_01688 [Rhodonia placenta]|uniref:TatD DNase family Scn1 n=1 Tax=Rhodonia placenta TaxID=104341 RepID=A0A8H7U5K8_9APHY|nr:hypothetical protein IEO21_01688 [Postia placenta]
MTHDLHPLPDPSILAHIVDVHCHPTDSPTPPEAMTAMSHRMCAMATRASDQSLVRKLAEQYPDSVIPCFGYHPWFYHWISLAPASAVPSKRSHYASLFLPSSKPQHADAFERLLPFLPDPTPLETVLAGLRADLTAFPHAMLGEVGLDRACRVLYKHPVAPPSLSPFTIPLAHQVAILEAQLALAVELRRNVSLHSVQAPQATAELLARMKAHFGRAWMDISVDLHSCGLSAEGWRNIERTHTNVFLSLSTGINARSRGHIALLRAAAPTRLLVESDFHDARLSAPYTWDMVCRIADARGWRVEQSAAEVEEVGGEDETQWGVVRRLAENWRTFENGGHREAPRTKKRDKRRLLLDDSEEEEDE